MSRISDEFRDAIGLQREREDQKPHGIFRDATSSAVKSMSQLAQHQIYADMHAGSMGDELAKPTDRVVTETQTTTRRVSSRPTPNIDFQQPSAEDYEFVD